MDTNLTARQEEVVNALTENGGDVHATAAQLNCTAPNIWKMMRHPKVQEEMVAQSRMALAKHMLPAVASIASLSQAAKSEYVRLEASKAILDRVGLSEPKDNNTLAIQINLDTTG